MEDKVKLQLERRYPNRRKIILTLPPLPNGGTVELIQGTSRKDDDYCLVPKGTLFSRPKPTS